MLWDNSYPILFQRVRQPRRGMSIRCNNSAGLNFPGGGSRLWCCCCCCCCGRNGLAFRVLGVRVISCAVANNDLSLLVLVLVLLLLVLFWLLFVVCYVGALRTCMCPYVPATIRVRIVVGTMPPSEQGAPVWQWRAYDGPQT